MADAAARLARALMLLEARRFDLAERELLEALALAPDDAEVHANMAWCQHGLGRTAAALGHIRLALAAQPDNASFHRQSAHFLQVLGRNREALAAIAEARRLAPDDPTVLTESARIDLALARWTAALAGCDQTLARDPALGDVHGMRAMALLNLGRGAEAEQAAAAALASQPEALVPHLAAAWTQLHGGDARAAQAGFREALRLDPGNAGARAGLLIALRRTLPIAGMPRLLALLAVVAVIGLPALAWYASLAGTATTWERWLATAVAIPCLYPLSLLPLCEAWVCRTAIGRDLLAPAQRLGAALAVSTLLGAAGLAGWALAGGGPLTPALVMATLIVPIAYATHPSYDRYRRLVEAMRWPFIGLAALALAAQAGVVPLPAQPLMACHLWAAMLWLFLVPNLPKAGADAPARPLARRRHGD